MAKDLKISYLLDFYGRMLTDPQRDMMEAYYNEDLSLGEIAQERGISRQGVRDAVKRAEQQLREMEDRLGLVRRFRAVREALTTICDCALEIREQGGEDPAIRQNADRILEQAEAIAAQDWDGEDAAPQGGDSH